MARRSRRGGATKGLDEPSVSLGPSPGGIDEISPETDLPEGHLRKAVNADFDRSGWFRRRPGQTQFAVCTHGRSIFSDGEFLFWNDGATLYRCPPSAGNTPEAIATLYEDYLSSCNYRGEIYFSDGMTKGKIVNGEYSEGWWTPTPQHPVTVVAATGGALPAGDYFVTTTYISDATGIESGAHPGTRCRVEQGGKIEITGIPQLAGHTTVIYVTHAGDPEIYYRHSMVLNGITSWSVAQDANGIRLETRHLEEMPAGHIVRAHRGRLFVAKGSTLHYSPALLPGLTRLSDMRLEFPERISIVQPVTDGLFVVSDRVYWIPNFGPEGMPAREMIYEGRAVEGSGLTLPGHFFPETPTGDVAYWMGENGAMLGLPGGRVNPVQERKVAPDLLTYGASLYRRENGLSHVVTAAQGVMAPGRAGARDSITCTVKRNGVIIPA